RGDLAAKVFLMDALRGDKYALWSDLAGKRGDLARGCGEKFENPVTSCPITKKTSERISRLTRFDFCDRRPWLSQKQRESG
ncbi:MAG TPA: hypothetical protein DEH22_05090, partial [Chloroflexi bacterium]|nr:hypothetical protein [Chloroflexota bacterium]